MSVVNLCIFLYNISEIVWINPEIGNRLTLRLLRLNTLPILNILKGSMRFRPIKTDPKWLKIDHILSIMYIRNVARCKDR